MKHKTITGQEAIKHAEENGSKLRKYADPIESGREVSIEEAREIAKIDPSLIYTTIKTY